MAVSKKDKLKTKSKATLGTQSKAVSVKKNSNLSKIETTIKRVKSNITYFKTLQVEAEGVKQKVAEDLIYLKENQNQLKDETGLTFQEFLKQEIDISKSYFYEQIQAYELCLEYNKPSIYEKADYRVLSSIAKIDDSADKKALFLKSPEMSRKDVKDEINRVRQTDSAKNKIIDVTPISDSSDVTVSLLDTMSIISNVFIDDEPKKTDHQKIEYSARLDATMRIMNLLQENDLIDKKESDKILKKLKKSII